MNLLDISTAMNAERMNQIGAAVHNLLPDTHGFIVITVPFGTGEYDNGEDAEAQYVSNCNREDAIAGLKILLFRWGVNEEWMTKAKSSQLRCAQNRMKNLA